MKQKIIKWIKKKPTNREMFVILALFLVGRWFLPVTTLYSAPLMVGLKGIELTNTQIQNISLNVQKEIIPSLEHLNQLGLSYQNSFVGYVINLLVGALPYITFIWVSTVALAVIRIIIGFIYTKWKSTKKS